MPERYTFRSQNIAAFLDDYDSEYESDGETSYKDSKEQAKCGSYAQVRKFKSQNNKFVAIASPKSENYQLIELLKKYRFYTYLYPEEKPALFFYGRKKQSPIHPDINRITCWNADKLSSYRLKIPFISGEPLSIYSECFLTEEEQIKLFLSVVKALQLCHAKNLVCLDLKEDNILIKDGECKLIDGGFSQPIGEIIEQNFFLVTPETVEEFIKKYPHVAPECWYDNKIYVQPSMDVYSLGSMMGRILRGQSCFISKCIAACVEKEPSQRINLNDLEQKLSDALQKMEKDKQIDSSISAFSSILQNSPVCLAEGLLLGTLGINLISSLMLLPNICQYNFTGMPENNIKSNAEIASDSQSLQSKLGSHIASVPNSLKLTNLLGHQSFFKNQMLRLITNSQEINSIDYEEIKSIIKL